VARAAQAEGKRAGFLMAAKKAVPVVRVICLALTGRKPGRKRLEAGRAGGRRSG